VNALLSLAQQAKGSERLGTLRRAATVVTGHPIVAKRERERERRECRGNAKGAVFVQNFRIWHTTE